MEVCGGGGLLKHLLEKGTSGYGLGEAEGRRMFRQLVGGVAYLHKVGPGERALASSKSVGDGSSTWLLSELAFGFALLLASLGLPS
jgi:hypothetical protein